MTPEGRETRDELDMTAGRVRQTGLENSTKYNMQGTGATNEKSDAMRTQGSVADWKFVKSKL